MYPFKLLIEFVTHKSYRGRVFLTFSIILFGTIIYHFVEGWRWPDSLYFSVVTHTTVGYGDFSPQTDFGKIFTLFTSLQESVFFLDL